MVPFGNTAPVIVLFRCLILCYFILNPFFLLLATLRYLPFDFSAPTDYNIDSVM